MAPQRKPVKSKKIVPAKSVKIGHVDYKDTATLRKFISERGKIRARRVTGLSVQEQRMVAIAVKNAYQNPRPLERPAIRDLLQAAWEGRRPGG